MPVETAVVVQTIEQGRALMEATGAVAGIPTIFVGGGTPSVLDRALLGRLLGFLGGIRRSGPPPGPEGFEWTLEANPESIGEAFLDACEAAGVTRLSLGVQSLRDPLLKLLRRSATRASTLRGLGLAARRWPGRLNLDFIAGIPSQTPEEVREDLAAIDEVRAGHVSLYQLTCEPGTPLSKLVEDGGLNLNPAERDEELWFAGRDELLRRGFRHYEISNFCKPGMECRHNVRYWRMEPYLGIGPGAVSTLPAKPLEHVLQRTAGEGEIVRLTNPRDLAAFSRGQDHLWGMQIETVTPRDFLMENLMMGLRLESGIPRESFELRFGATFDGLFPGLRDSWESAGWIDPSEDRIALNADGRVLLDHVLAGAMQALSEEAVGRMRISWP
jgi:oxygen-independent coproporphyrinogen-3 oxidase